VEYDGQQAAEGSENTRNWQKTMDRVE